LSNPIYSYDAAGDILTEGGNTLTYDAEGRILTAESTSYLYDGNGQRSSKITGGVETDFVRDFDGTLLDTYVSGSYINQPQEMWIAGKHYGTVYPFVSNGVQEQGEGLSLTNWLGSEAMRSFAVSTNGVNTGVPTYAFLSLPFGDGQTTLIGSDNNDIHFTGKERDAESGNDYFGARYYASSMGRYMSPDWSAKAEPVPYSKLDNPQSLNLYSYVLNNPLSAVDQDGHFSTDSYNVDKYNHGGIHIDRVTKDGHLVGRYNPDGTPLVHKGKTPSPIPKADKEKFDEAAKKAQKQAMQDADDFIKQQPPLPQPPLPDGLKPDPTPPAPTPVPPVIPIPLPAPVPMPNPTPPMPMPEPLPPLPPMPMPEPFPIIAGSIHQ
jgi:RHS repeat-associated protein